MKSHLVVIKIILKGVKFCGIITIEMILIESQNTRRYIMKKLIPIILSLLMLTGCAGGSSSHADVPKVDTPPVDTPLVDTPPVDTPPVDTPPVDTLPVDTPPVDTPPVDAPSVDTPPVTTYRSITMDEAVTMMAQETGYIILDVRRPDEFAAGHIPNAINVANETIGTSEIAELPDKDQLIMVYCRSGRRSKEASEKLVKLGYTNIVEFGGILDWKGEIEK